MIPRECVRALVEDDQGRVLLVRIVERSSSRAFWITPGGGVEEGESDTDALARELHEETGIAKIPVGPLVWTRDFTFSWEGVTYRQVERFYWLKVTSFRAKPTALQGNIEVTSFDTLRWWTVAEIAEASETFAPLDLAEQIIHLRAGGPQPLPVALGR